MNQTSNDNEILLRKVNVRALDLDWIFQDENFKNMLNILSGCHDETILTTKQFRIIIDFAWQKFQKAILKYIVVPFLVMMVLIMYIVVYLMNEFNDIIYKDLTDAKVKKELQVLKVKSYIITAIVTVLVIFFAGLESL